MKPDNNTPRATLSRRRFVGGAAGLTFAIGIAPGAAGVLSAATARKDTLEIGAWVRISLDETVTIITPAAEMGQGSMTGVPVALAEELDADWSRVKLEMAPAEPAIYGFDRRGEKLMAIVGSLAVRSYFDQVRLAGAQVRRFLIDQAAAEWGIGADALDTEPGRVVDRGSARSLSYGEIAGFAEMPERLPEVAPGDLKQPRDFRLIGTPVPRRDIPPKTDGSAQFSIDVTLPGMAYASVVHSPVQGGRPARWNEEAIASLPGVRAAVALDHGVAVVADSFELALAARGELVVDWDAGAPAEGYDSEAMLESGYADLLAAAGQPDVVGSAGRGAAAFDDAAKRYRSVFRADYGYHAQMEPLNAVARFDKAAGTIEVWEGTQAPGRSRESIAEALGLDIDSVIHHQQYLGGGFGRRSISDYTIEAALIARATGLPIKMIWTREEDLAYGMFRPQNLQCVEAALDSDGNVTGWRQCVVGDGDRLLYSGINIEQYYGIPDRQVETRGTSHGIRLKHWRAVAHPFNLFAIESLVDEMAADAGLDPFTFRRRHMAPTPKAEAVFDEVEKLSEWHRRRPDGRALGLAISERSDSLAAGVVEISLDGERIRVHKVWIAVDGGIIVQPDMARANVESGVVYGLSSVLKERATVRNGVVQQSNFHDYQVLRMSEAPEEIHVGFIERDTPPTGIGEIGNPFVAAAVANAFFALTGKRLRHMPFTPERVRAALAA